VKKKLARARNVETVSSGRRHYMVDGMKLARERNVGS
jgi:hypothetical protein